MNVDVLVAARPEPRIGAGFTHRFQAAAVRGGFRPIRDGAGPIATPLGKLCAKLKLLRPIRKRRRMIGLIGAAAEHLTFPAAWTHELVPWCFDVWPGNVDRWVAMLRRHRVRTAFFTARDAIDLIAPRVPGLRAEWLPEAADPSLLDPTKSLTDRTIDVLEFGRRHEPFSSAIAAPLASAGRRHVIAHYHDPAFATMDRLYAALADAKLAVCFPRSVTDPHLAGSVETMTLRYLEAMAAGCLIVGQAPRELVDYAGYAPVIEASPADGARVLDAVLRDLATHEPLRQRNLAFVRERMTWDVRVAWLRERLSLGTDAR